MRGELKAKLHSTASKIYSNFLWTEVFYLGNKLLRTQKVLKEKSLRLKK